MARGALTIRLDAEGDPTLLAAAADRAITVLERGGTVIVPTDTVYGVAAHPRRASGTERLFALKDRTRAKALAVLAADRGQAAELLDLSRLDDTAGRRTAVEQLMSAGWPGALTVVGPRAAAWRHVELGGDPALIGVRVPHAVVVRAIAARIGPIVTTSANRSGEPTPTDAVAAAGSLVDEVDLVIDAGPGGALASTVVDVTATPFRLVRRGAVDPVALGVDPALFDTVGARTAGASDD